MVLTNVTIKSLFQGSLMAFLYVSVPTSPLSIFEFTIMVTLEERPKEERKKEEEK